MGAPRLQDTAKRMCSESHIEAWEASFRLLGGGDVYIQEVSCTCTYVHTHIDSHVHIPLEDRIVPQVIFSKHCLLTPDLSHVHQRDFEIKTRHVSLSQLSSLGLDS